MLIGILGGRLDLWTNLATLYFDHDPWIDKEGMRETNAHIVYLLNSSPRFLFCFLNVVTLVYHEKYASIDLFLNKKTEPNCQLPDHSKPSAVRTIVVCGLCLVQEMVYKKDMQVRKWQTRV